MNDLFFCLDINTTLNGPACQATNYAIKAFYRDMNNTLNPTVSKKKSHIELILDEHQEIPAENYRIEFLDEFTMHIIAADFLGLVYGVYFISEHFLDVHPFWFWNDQKFEKRDFVLIPLKKYTSQKYRIRFRGWFVNDEVLIDQWRSGKENLENWEMVFEALLRCGGNMVIPGTDENSKKYRKLASEMGLWITHHHAEPLGAEMFLRAYPNEAPSYDINSHLYKNLWEKAIAEQKNCNVIWTLGFRGQGDRPFWNDDPAYKKPAKRGALISHVIKEQMNLIKKYFDNPICCTNLYGEIMELYKNGHLNLPEGIIKIWADNGYGKMVSRRQGNHNPRVPALPTPNETKPHGIYYHCSFHDLQASNHITMSPNSAEFLQNELEHAFECGADEYLIVNCGSLKPHIYTLDLISKIWRNSNVSVQKHRLQYSKEYYGDKKEEISDCLREFANCTILYGKNEDEHAGEQLYHHSIQQLSCAWLRGDTEKSLNSLLWLTGDIGFAGQAAYLKNLCIGKLANWESLNKKCKMLYKQLNPKVQQLFSDSILLQVQLHLSGIKGVIAFCSSLKAYLSGDYLQAFLFACNAEEEFFLGIKALESAEHDKWIGYYKNDCLTNIRLTNDCINSIICFLRVIGDGPSFHKWEKEYIYPKENKGIELLSCKTLHLSNRELYTQLKKIIEF